MDTTKTAKYSTVSSPALYCSNNANGWASGWAGLSHTFPSPPLSGYPASSPERGWRYILFFGHWMELIRARFSHKSVDVSVTLGRMANNTFLIRNIETDLISFIQDVVHVGLYYNLYTTCKTCFIKIEFLGFTNK